MKATKILSLILAFAMVLSLGIGAFADGELEDGTVTMFADGTAGYKLEPEARDADYEGEFYLAKYFGDDVTAGVLALVEKGGVTVNGFAVPTQEEVTETVNNDGSYEFRVNGSAEMSSDEMNYDGAADAAVSMIGQLLKAAGTEITITVEGGEVVGMDLMQTAGILVDHTEETDGGTIAYTDGEPAFTAGGASGEPTEFAVEDVTDGCIAVYWEDPDGWHLQGAEAVRGYLTDGADHEFYVLEDEDGNTMEYQDAAMYSRGFSDGNRPGQFINTQMHFELNDIPVTVWFIPGTAHSDVPMPIGITGLENARTRLERAMEYTQNVIDSTVIAADADEAAALAEEQGLEDFHWITQEVSVVHTSEITGKNARGALTMLTEKLDEAQAILDDPNASPADFDQEAYELFIAMWGSSSDIGAVFQGTVKEGFFDVADDGANALPAAVLK